MSLKYSMKTIVRITIMLVIIKQIYSIIEYNINDELAPSFLKYTSMDLNDTIIPSDLKFRLSLSRIIGTLLYAIDSQQNQLILSLNENINERLKIEFRGVDEYIFLEKLCGCNRCKYQWLSFNVKIENKIKIKCNQEKFYEFQYNERKQLSTDYPILNQSEKFAIYFINTPKHKTGYPNSEQLQGCIKDVLLNGKSMDLKPFPKGIPKCESSCANNVCNTGKCHETFSKNVICDCSDSFLNGEYCNSSMLNSSTCFINRKLKFIKLTWKSKSVNILNINYGNFNFSIKYEDRSLIAMYEERNEVIKGTLPKFGDTSTNFILYISFHDTSVNCKFIKSNQNISGKFDVPRDISKEYVKSLKLLDRDDKKGKIDIVYKNDLLEYTWKSAVSHDCKVDLDEPKLEYPEKEATPPWKCVILAFEVLAIVISIIIWICIRKEELKLRNGMPKSTESILLNPLENKEKRV